MLWRTPLPPVILADYLRSAWSVSITAVLWLCTVPAFGQDIQFSNHLLDRALAGHVQDQLEVARAFQLGLGVERDASEAARWYRKAADQGNLVAQHQLGLLYLLGAGVPRDDREAFKWYQRAALENYPPAQFSLGRLFLKGRGVSQDYQQGVPWMTRASVNVHVASIRREPWIAMLAAVLGNQQRPRRQHGKSRCNRAQRAT